MTGYILRQRYEKASEIQSLRKNLLEAPITLAMIESHYFYEFTYNLFCYFYYTTSQAKKQDKRTFKRTFQNKKDFKKLSLII